MVEEKRIKIINELENIPEEVLDNILILLEDSKKATISDNE